LQFTRFGTPVPDRYPMASLLDPCLTDLTPELMQRRLLLDYQPAATSVVFVDGPQIAYAIENLSRLIIRELGEGETLAVRSGDESTLTFEFAGAFELTASKLGGLLAHGGNGSARHVPLGLVFAKALIERNGGTIDTRSAAERTCLTVRLPSAPATVSANGTAARPHR